MRAKRVSKSEQFQLILECRQSGLTDVQWCRENNIKPSGRVKLLWSFLLTTPMYF